GRRRTRIVSPCPGKPLLSKGIPENCATCATTPANANVSPFGPPPAITTACSVIATLRSACADLMSGPGGQGETAGFLPVFLPGWRPAATVGSGLMQLKGVRGGLGAPPVGARRQPLRRIVPRRCGQNTDPSGRTAPKDHQWPSSVSCEGATGKVSEWHPCPHPTRQERPRRSECKRRAEACT